MSAVVPKKCEDIVKDVFPKSEDRRRVAVARLGYGHTLTAEEPKELAAHGGWQDAMQVTRILDILQWKGLWDEEVGRVSLFEATLLVDMMSQAPLMRREI